jgi:hypothetical protein
MAACVRRAHGEVAQGPGLREAVTGVRTTGLVVGATDPRDNNLRVGNRDRVTARFEGVGGNWEGTRSSGGESRA